MIEVGENWYMQAKYTNPICVSICHLQKLSSFDILTFKKELPTFLGSHPFFYCHGLKQKKSPCTVATIDSWGVAFRSCSGCLPQTGTTCQSCQHGEPCEAQVKPITRMCKQCGCKKNPLEEQKKHSRGGWLTKQSIVTKAPWTKPRSVETVFKIPQIIYIYIRCACFQEMVTIRNGRFTYPHPRPSFAKFASTRLLSNSSTRSTWVSMEVNKY